MKKNKNILMFLGFIACSISAQSMAVVHRHIPGDGSDCKEMIPPPPHLSESLAVGVGALTVATGTVLRLYGLYTFLSNINFFISGEKLADYSKQELATLSAEKLATLIAREEKRVKEKREGVKKILIGLACESIGVLLAASGFATYGLRAGCEMQEERCNKEFTIKLPCITHKGC